MYKKIVFATLLIAFAFVQLAYSLQCFECGSPSECRNPMRTTCNEKAGNATTKRLANYYRDVSNKTDTNFECIHLNGTENNVNVMEVRGCLFYHIDACNLVPLPQHSNLAKTNCTRCAGNYCNGKNSPAGTFSSSVYTMTASAVLVLVAKMTLN